MTIRRVYIAGPYAADTKWEEEQNVRRAEEVGYEVARLGAYPVIPHANTRHYFSDVQPPDFWYAATMAEMKTCDAVLLVDGWKGSVGATAEAEEAFIDGIYVFTEIHKLEGWLREGA